MALVREQAPAKSDRGDRVERGTGAGEYKVKGKRATAKQRSVIDEGLSQAQDDNASRRVMVAVVMAMTQESRCGEDVQRTGNDDTGILQQGRNWISEEDSKKAGPAVHAFLVTGPTAWKKVHGGVKKAPGNLSQAIHEVQGNADPQAYAAWEEEAEQTVDAWFDSGGSEGAGDSYPKRYTFTRGEKAGSRENSWDAMQRLVEEVGAYRWAAGNVLYAVSGDELRAGGPSVMIRGDEGWLQKGPQWSWSAGRALTEVTLSALADRWDVMPGGIVSIHRRYGRAMMGKWMVWNVSGSRLDSPEVTIVLRRPTRLKSEPPTETASRAGDEGGGGGGGSSELKDICQRFTGPYDYGGGHGPKLSSLTYASALDCSSSTSLALKRAGMFNGDVAIVSGQFATSWGKPGEGEEFTVWANGGHVYIKFADGNEFNTAGHPSVSGPRYGKFGYRTSGLTPRHWPGR